MKKILIAMLCILFMICLISCTNADNDKSDFAYYFVIDKTKDGKILLCSVMKKDVQSSKKDVNKPFVEEFVGSNIDDAFNYFFEKNKTVYTGTVKEYAVGENMGEDGLFDFKVYLTNSPKLPAKRKTVSVKDTRMYIDEKIKGEL